MSFTAIATRAAAAGLALGATSVRAEDVADFYRGRTLTILVGGTAGASYDLQGRLIARHMARHVPGNPSIVVQNMIGAGGLKMVNFLYGQAPRDGAYLGMIPNTLPALQAVGAPGVAFDAGKLNWIGTINPVTVTMTAWKATGIRSIADVRAREVVAAASARGAITYTIPAMFNALLGPKFRIVTGYEGLSDISLSLERGEAEVAESSVSNWKLTKPDWIRDGKIVMFVQTEPKSAELPGVPTAEELASNDDDRRVIEIVNSGSKLGFPLAGAPGATPERVAALRAAFAATMKDEAFLKEAEASQLDVTPVSGERLAEIVAKVLDAPKRLVDRARPIISP